MCKREHYCNYLYCNGKHKQPKLTELKGETKTFIKGLSTRQHIESTTEIPRYSSVLEMLCMLGVTCRV